MEQRYLEETTMRQVAIDTASIPKDARIAALEKNGADAERVIADARIEKMKQFEDMQNSQVSPTAGEQRYMAICLRCYCC
jgi:angiomotin like 1